jgi:hypothetical protein
MAEMVSGGCLCGAYTYRFDREKVLSASHCHCTDCQKSTGSGKATILFVPEADLSTTGDLKFYTVVGVDGGHVSRGFCPECGSPVISQVEEMPGVKFVKAGSLDDSSWVQINSSFWNETAQPWSPVDESQQSFPRNPVM